MITPGVALSRELDTTDVAPAADVAGVEFTDRSLTRSAGADAGGDPLESFI
jgi:hypothetical protein